MEFIRQVGAVAGKDLRVEFRSREILYTMLLFAVMVILIFSFAFVDGGTGKAIGNVSSGILWITVLFSGTLGLARAFDRERESNTMRGLLLSPVPRAAIFAGKAVSIWVFMMIVLAVVVPLIVVFFGAPLFGDPLGLLLTLALTTVAVAVVGSVFASMLLRARSRAVLLPVVLYPVLVPVMIAATKATGALIAGPAEAPVMFFWIKFLAVFDGLFLLAALWLFESLVIE